MMSHQIENINRGRNYLKNIFLNEINSLEKLKSIFEHKEERFCKTEDGWADLTQPLEQKAKRLRKPEQRP